MTELEWLAENIDNLIPYVNDASAKKFNELVEQAKEMEKQQQDEFAIGFAEWCLKIRFEPIENISVKKLLEIYKKDNL
jgi:hypothetical protein